MHKSQCIKTRNINKEGNITPPKVNNLTVKDTKDRGRKGGGGGEEERGGGGREGGGGQEEQEGGRR
jgi:hypothetical protein